jgi:hypothetical protein
MIDEAFEICSYDPGRVKSTWVRRLTLEGTDGLLAILESPERKFVAVVNLPIIVMPVYGKILSVGDVMEVLTATPGIPNAQFPFRGNALFVVQCLPLGTIDEAKPGETMDSLKDSLNSFRRDLLAAIRHFHDIPVPEEDTYPKPVLPNIKMTPKDMRVILSLLESCNAQVQEIYTEIMESWVRSGNIVGTTSFSAVLDIPYGDRTARFAMLTPGLSKGRAVMIPAGRPYPPRIILFWGSLRKFYKGFPAECIDKYQKTVRKIAPIHTTRASAYIEMSDKFDVSAARSLLKAMRTLAKTVRPEMVGKPGTSGPVTPDNIRQTLLTCLVPVQEIYRQLMDGWKAAGGSVQCAKPGRIYLRMKTKEHARGWFAKIRRNFNLVVLAGPRNKKPANMQICWNLATVGSAAYLDCIPEEVDRFEKVIAALPGFERKGTITYLWIGEEFNPDKTALLLEAMVRLRKAEQASI